MIKKDDYVTRKSYDNDIVFKVLFIMNNIAYLQGVDIRLIADSYIDDLVKVEQIRNNQTVETLPIQKGNYLNGKVLHLLALGQLSLTQETTFNSSSAALIISPIEYSSGFLLNLYPPSLPLATIKKPAFLRLIIIFSRYFNEIFSFFEISVKEI